MNPFTEALRAFEEYRHARIVDDVSELGQRRARGRHLQIDDEGYMPIADAAEVMQVSEREVTLLARRGVLNWRSEGTRVEIQPAVVTGLANFSQDRSPTSPHPTTPRQSASDRKVYLRTPARLLLGQRACEVCGESYTPVRLRQRWCSTACRNRRQR